MHVTQTIDYGGQTKRKIWDQQYSWHSGFVIREELIIKSLGPVIPSYGNLVSTYEKWEHNISCRRLNIKTEP